MTNSESRSGENLRVTRQKAIEVPVGMTSSPKFVSRDGLMHLPTAGRGILRIVDKKGNRSVYYTDEDNREPIEIPRDSYFFWKTINFSGENQSLGLIELCVGKLYESADIQDVNMISEDVPETFKEEYRTAAGFK